MPKRVIIDTDPGIDDAAAILLALASPELSVEALTTVYGNGPVETCTANAFRILHAAGRLDIPVFQGAGKPLLRPPNEGWASLIHGQDALGNSDSPLPPASAQHTSSRHAALEIIDRVTASPGEITVLALGRLTNLALALSLEPSLAQSVAAIIVMGGAIAVPGNVSAVASANLYEDPEAAAIVYSSGATLVQVGLDVCNLVTISKPNLERIATADTPTTRLLAAAATYLQKSYVERGLLDPEAGVRFNDIPAVAYASDSALFQTVQWHVEIETQSPVTRGQTVAHRHDLAGRTANATVCVDVDALRLADIFTQRIVDYRPP